MHLKAEVDGILTPEGVSRIRRKLGLSQRRAGALLGGGPRSFQKYESGTDWVTRSMSNLLLLLDRDPTRLSELIAANERGGRAVRTRNRRVIARARGQRRPAASEG